MPAAPCGRRFTALSARAKNASVSRQRGQRGFGAGVVAGHDHEPGSQGRPIGRARALPDRHLPLLAGPGAAGPSPSRRRVHVGEHGEAARASP